MTTARPSGHKIDWASFAFQPPFEITEPKKGNKRKGILYERKAQRYLMGCLGEMYWPSPWIAFKADNNRRVRWIQPDGILVDPEAGLITVVEIKYSHTIDAYLQLEMKYIPVLKWLFPERLWRFAALEVVHWFDPTIKFPRGFRMVKNPALMRGSDFGVHIYNP